MPETKNFQQIREKFAELFKEQNNENLAETIETTTAKELGDNNYIQALKQTYPEFNTELETLKKEIQNLQKQGKKEYNPETYFVRNSSGNLKFNPDKIARELEKEYKFKYVEDTNQFYIYENQYWQNRAERVIKEEVNTRLGERYEPRYSTKTVDTIQTRKHISTTKKDFRPSKEKIPFKSCVYNLETGEKEDHKPENNFTYKIPYELDRNSQCPRINKFLDEVTETERDKELILETIGYSLLADMPYGHSLILHGKGKNGKSVLLDVWKEMLGADQYKEEDLQQLENGRFATRWLYRKLALFSDDLPPTTLETGNTLKSLTGGGDTRAEIKGGDHFDFQNFATPVFACNEIPVSKDDSDGFFRRWEIVNFPYKFVDEPVKDNHKQKQPKDQLEKELTCESEMQGLLNEALTRLELAKDNGGLYHKTSADDTRSLWKNYSTPFEQFVENCLEQGMTQKDAQELDGDSINTDLTEYDYDFIVKDDLVWLIRKYCEHYSKRPPTKTKITQYLKNDSPYYVQEGRTRQLGGNNERKRVYKFLKFSDEFLEFVEKEKKCPECPYFFANLRAHARKVERSLEKSRDSKDTSFSTVGELIREFVESESEQKVKEQKIIEQIEEPEQKIEETLEEMIHDGEMYRPEPGVVSKL